MTLYKAVKWIWDNRQKIAAFINMMKRIWNQVVAAAQAQCVVNSTDYGGIAGNSQQFGIPSHSLGSINTHRLSPGLAAIIGGAIDSLLFVVRHDEHDVGRPSFRFCLSKRRRRKEACTAKTNKRKQHSIREHGTHSKKANSLLLSRARQNTNRPAALMAATQDSSSAASGSR